MLVFVILPHISIDDTINRLFEPFVNQLYNILFWDPVRAMGININAEVPLVVIWLIFGGIFFTFRYKFINIRAFKHAIDLIRGKYDKPDFRGEVSHFQALTTALSATVGLGNIAGVAIAISLGGPGATFWMILAGILGMSLKFTECTLGLKYRKINNGEVSGGPMYYLHYGLGKKGWKNIGKLLAVIYAVLIVFASFGGGNMLQSNQAFAQLAALVPFFLNKGWIVGLFLAFFVGLVIIGGIKSIARVTEKIVPIMAIIYVLTSLIIIFYNFSFIDDGFKLIINDAFNKPALQGGVIGALIMGFRRGAFSNEAGIGSASVAHSAAKTNEPVSEGIVSLLEPFIDTVVICTMTAFVIIFTGFYKNPDGLEGAPLTSAAYGSVFPFFPYLLLISIFLFAFSTMISWSYYGLKGFNYLFQDHIVRLTGNKKISSYIFQLTFLLCVIIGSASNLFNVINFSDMMILGLAFPNIIGLLILSGEVNDDLTLYFKRLKKRK